VTAALGKNQIKKTFKIIGLTRVGTEKMNSFTLCCTNKFTMYEGSRWPLDSARTKEAPTVNGGNICNTRIKKR
jgi:hypothetical protein